MAYVQCPPIQKRERLYTRVPQKPASHLELDSLNARLPGMLSARKAPRLSDPLAIVSRIGSFDCSASLRQYIAATLFCMSDGKQARRSLGTALPLFGFATA